MSLNLSIIVLLLGCVSIALTWLAAQFYFLRQILPAHTRTAPYLTGFIVGTLLLVAGFYVSAWASLSLAYATVDKFSVINLLPQVFMGTSALVFLIALGVLLKNKRQTIIRSQVRRNAEAQPAGSSSHTDMNPIFKHSPALYLITDKKQNIVDANPALVAFLNTSTDELKSKKLKDMVVEEDHALLKGLTPSRIQQSTSEEHVSLRLTRYENEPLWVKLYASHIAWGRKQEPACLLLLQDNREAKNLSELITFHSQYDELTMLHNRESMENYLAQVLDISKENKSQIALFYIDVDQLKVVNDTCGHTAGDRLLQYLVTVLGDASPECNFFARIGGDEFVMVKIKSNEQEALAIAERVRSAAEDFTFVWRNQNYRQSISIGLALSSKAMDDVVNLVGAADSACYTAKLNGKNRVVLYSESIAKSQDNRRDMMWVSRLQQAIQQGQFILYFQPIHRLDSPRSAHVHYELLIRYVDDQGTHILPQHFLPAVERFGLSEQIDLWVLTTALDFLDKHPEHTKILDCCSINLTSQSIANPRIRSAILQVVQSYSFDLDKICFEITESSAIHNLKEAQEFVNELKTLGCKLALDDFGTGFSSFGYLKHLNVDYIKIDGSFVRDIIDDRFDRAMVAAINNIGKEMNIEIIAEYAEKPSILKVLREMHVEYAQGHAIAKPLPIDKLELYYSPLKN